MGNLANLQATTVVSESDQNKIATINALLQILDDSVAGQINVTVTTADVVLTGTPAAPQAQHLFVNATGALTGNRAISVPVTAAGIGKNRLYVVTNGCTGAFTLTFKVAGQTGVVIPQGTTALLLFNGSDMQFVSNPVLSSGGSTIGARAYHSTTQSITNNTQTALSLDSERLDTNAIHDTATNNTRLTCKTAGTYMITGCISYAANATGARQAAIKLNGTTFIVAQLQTSNGAVLPSNVTCATIYPLAVNDYVELFALQDSGGALNSTNTANFAPEFAMVRIGN